MKIEKTRRIELEKQRIEHKKKALAEEMRLQEERKKCSSEAENERLRQLKDAPKHKKDLEKKHRIEEEKRQEDIRRREDDFKHNMETNFSQQETQVKDGKGDRWIKCEYCGKIAKVDAFVSYGGEGKINLGTCKECRSNNPTVKERTETPMKKSKKKYDPYVCPDCGGKLRERSRPYGRFLGCSNYPTCRYNRKIR